MSGGAIVETCSGRIEGRREGALFVFRGIPYAASPAGTARWRAPGPVAPWRGIRPARVPGPIAPQARSAWSALLGAGEHTLSEDCLALDVWTPGPGSRRRPVMVWLHGGGFTTGAGSLGIYAGRRLAEVGDAVIVTLNYRLGALGFLYLPELAESEGGAPGNFGLLDQIAALEWVQQNIEAFGGDPDRVTLFGQSAGAMCAADLLASPRADALFARCILQSGAANNVHTPEVALRVREVFCEECAVPAAPFRARIEALRALPVEALLRAQTASLERLRREVQDPAFQPVVDGAVLPEAPARAASAPLRPLLVGTNLDEWKFYGLTDPKAADLDLAGLRRRFERGLPGVDPQGRPLAERVIEVYRQARSGRASLEPRELWFAIQSDRWFRMPAIELAERNAQRGAPTHQYLFTWPSPAFGGRLGSCHSIELPFVFGRVGAPELQALVPDDPGLHALAARMQEVWAAFAQGDAPAWPAYDVQRRTTRIFGLEDGVEAAPGEIERRFWASLR